MGTVGNENIFGCERDSGKDCGDGCFFQSDQVLFFITETKKGVGFGEVERSVYGERSGSGEGDAGVGGEPGARCAKSPFGARVAKDSIFYGVGDVEIGEVTADKYFSGVGIFESEIIFRKFLGDGTKRKKGSFFGENEKGGEIIHVRGGYGVVTAFRKRILLKRTVSGKKDNGSVFNSKKKTVIKRKKGLNVVLRSMDCGKGFFLGEKGVFLFGEEFFSRGYFRFLYDSF